MTTIADRFKAANGLRLGSVDSTNTVLRLRVADNRLDKVWVAAQEQTHGKGRRGREWLSPAGKGLYASFLFEDSALESLVVLAQLVPLAMARATRSLTGAHVSLKWPNDLLLNDKKVGGTLLESFQHKGSAYLIAGVGINCTTTLAELPVRQNYPAASLTLELGRPVYAWQLLPRLISSLNELWRRKLHGETEAILQAWKSLLTVDTEQKWLATWEGHQVEGRILDVSLHGALRLLTADNQTITLRAGDLREI